MESAYIYGCFRFVGFHLCNYLLEKGWEVTGIDLRVNEDDGTAEEKKLEIGRNANFREYDLTSFSLDEDAKSPTAVIVSLYDFFMEHQDVALETPSFFDTLQGMFKENNANLHRPIFLLPLQLLDDSNQEEGLEKIRSFLKKDASLSSNAQYIYLPSMLGEWQPETYFVQKFLMGNAGEMKKAEREWTEDVVYIQDAISAIVEVVDWGIPGSYILESGKQNGWDKCRELLGIRPNGIIRENSKSAINPRGAKRVSLPSTTALEEAIKRQKAHNELFNKERI